MFREIVDKTSKIANGIRLDERLTPEELARARDELAVPDVRPCDFDVTFEAWLDRLSIWGKIRIKHTDPEFRFRGEVTQKKFLDKMANDSYMVKAFGKWELERTALNKCRLWRDYVGLDGKKYTEEFLVEVELKPDWKKG
jgi:hypothetical protein